MERYGPRLSYKSEPHMKHNSQYASDSGMLGKSTHGSIGQMLIQQFEGRLNHDAGGNQTHANARFKLLLLKALVCRLRRSFLLVSELRSPILVQMSCSDP